MRKLKLALYKLFPKKQCYICKTKFHHFTTFRNGQKGLSSYAQHLKMIGSNLDQYGCMYCKANDRERHLHMYFDAMNIWDRFKNSNIIHFAPEKILSDKIEQLKPSYYLKGDLFPSREDITKVDATDIKEDDNTFDVLICNHVLEHIPDYKKALSEFYRVLKPGGVAILQTPYSDFLSANFQDDSIQSEKEREFFYGQDDHARIFSGKTLFKSFEEAGFKTNTKQHTALFDEASAAYYGVNIDEPFMLVEKPL